MHDQPLMYWTQEVTGLLLNGAEEAVKLSSAVLGLKQAGDKTPKNVIACVVFVLLQKIFSINRLVLAIVKVQTVELLVELLFRFPLSIGELSRGSLSSGPNCSAQVRSSDPIDSALLRSAYAPAS
jgi:hypothetical protein